MLSGPNRAPRVIPLHSPERYLFPPSPFSIPRRTPPFPAHVEIPFLFPPSQTPNFIFFIEPPPPTPSGLLAEVGFKVDLSPCARFIVSLRSTPVLCYCLLRSFFLVACKTLFFLPTKLTSPCYGPKSPASSRLSKTTLYDTLRPIPGRVLACVTLLSFGFHLVFVDAHPTSVLHTIFRIPPFFSPPFSNQLSLTRAHASSLTDLPP